MAIDKWFIRATPLPKRVEVERVESETKGHLTFLYDRPRFAVSLSDSIVIFYLYI